MRFNLLFLLVLIPVVIYGQVPNLAYKLGVDGVNAIEKGETKTGIKLLKNAWELEPASYDYPFEIGRALFLDGNPKKAEKYLFPLQYHALVQADLYILLADCYKEIDQQKKTQDVNRKKELDALRYGIQKLPQSGILYLELGKRKIEQDETIDALSVFESGIMNAPNFTENYFWAAKLMKASRNHLWAWIYAELFLNLSDNIELNRTAARLMTESLQMIGSHNWVAEPEQMDQEFKLLLSDQCQLGSGLTEMVEFRKCLMQEWKGTNFAISPILKRSEQIMNQGYLEAYLGSIFLESDKEAFLTWLASNGEQYEAFRRWRYYNPMMLTQPIIRVQ